MGICWEEGEKSSEGTKVATHTSEFQSVRNVEGHPSRGKRAVSNIVRGCQKAMRPYARGGGEEGRQLFPSC